VEVSLNLRVLAGSAIALLMVCASHGASVEGQVFEVTNPEAPAGDWTHIPSVDAYVIVTWTATVPGLHVTSTCLHAAIGKTDGRGRFNVSGRWMPKPFPVIPRDPAVVVHKPGYLQHSESRNPGAPIARTLVRAKLPVEQRLERLSWLAESGCLDSEAFKTRPLGDAQGIAAGFYRALYDEAVGLGPLPPKLNHYLVPIRAKAGVPEPPEPPWKVQILRPGTPQTAAPAPSDRP
jgi:hypothetical protein